MAYRKAIILTCWQEKIADFVFILCCPFGWNPSALHSILWCFHQSTSSGSQQGRGYWEQLTQVSSKVPVGAESLVMRLEGKQSHFPWLTVCLRPQGGSMCTWVGPGCFSDFFFFFLMTVLSVSGGKALEWIQSPRWMLGCEKILKSQRRQWRGWWGCFKAGFTRCGKNRALGIRSPVFDFWHFHWLSSNLPCFYEN